MLYRIRIAALIIQNDKILLVKSVHSKSGLEWWGPPGGGLEDIDENIHDCAIRETCEGTGYTIDTGDILYISEFLDFDFDSHNLEIFIKGNIICGNIEVKNPFCRQCDDLFIQEAKWFSREELDQLSVFPQIIKTKEFWENYEKERYTQYLGRKKR